MVVRVCVAAAALPLRLRPAVVARLAHYRHQLPHPLGNAHRTCAYGKCGARPGPEYGSVSFPYYTVRGPRDFLAADPPSIGP